MQKLTALKNVAGTVVRKVVKSLRLRGLWGSLRLGSKKLLKAVRFQSRSAPDYDRHGAQFDLEHGTDTRQSSDPGWLGRLTSLNWIYGQAYHPAAVDAVQKAFEQLPAEFRDATFIDMGSGKGRILLLASRMQFRRVIGVEYDPLLHQIAASNVARFNAPEKARIELNCRDATEYPLPGGPLVIFFHHPFDSPVFKIVCSRLTAAANAGQQISVTYFDPKCRDVLDANPVFESHHEFRATTRDDVSYVIYRTRS